MLLCVFIYGRKLLQFWIKKQNKFAKNLVNRKNYTHKNYSFYSIGPLEFYGVITTQPSMNMKQTIQSNFEKYMIEQICPAHRPTSHLNLHSVISPWQLPLG